MNENACLPGSLFPYKYPRATLQDLQDELLQHGLEISDVRKSAPEVQLGNVVVSAWIHWAAEQMRFAAQVISGMFDLEMIVIGGAPPMPITERLVEAINEKTIPAPSRGLQAAPVVATRLGELNRPIGSASIPFFSSFFPASQ